MKFKKFCMILMAALFVACTPIIAFAEERTATQEEMQEVETSGKPKLEWENVGTNWKLLYLLKGQNQWAYAKSWVQIGADFYYFDEDGNMKEGWFQDQKGVWYFATCDNLTCNSPDAGKILTGWAYIGSQGGQKHYFYFTSDENGRPSGMFQSTIANQYAHTTIGEDTYIFDTNGYCSTKPKNYYDIKEYKITRGTT